MFWKKKEIIKNGHHEITLSFPMEKEKERKIKCPCCNKIVSIPVKEYSTGFNFKITTYKT